MGGELEAPSATATVPPAPPPDVPSTDVPSTESRLLATAPPMNMSTEFETDTTMPSEFLTDPDAPYYESKFRSTDTLRSPPDILVASPTVELKELITKGAPLTGSPIVSPTGTSTTPIDDTGTGTIVPVIHKLLPPVLVWNKISLSSRWDTVFDVLRATLSASGTAFAEILSIVKAGFYSYDWIGFCFKLCIALNPIYMMVMGFNPEVLRETDFKGAFGCFAMLTWALVTTGRAAYVSTLYTSALTGVLVQYALLQARGHYTPESELEDDKTGDSAASGCAYDPAAESDRQPEQWKPPCLSEVTAALAFCSLPLSVCAIVAQFLVDSVSPLMAPLPAAWCTLLAVCALLPPARRQVDRPFVIVPSGIMFTWLSLIFIV